MKWTIIMLGALAAAGCQDRLELAHASCPCADGWVCCEALDMCVTDVAECVGEAPAELDASPSPGEPDAGDSAAGYAIYLAFEGGAVSPGADDAAAGTSSVVEDAVDLPAFSVDRFATAKPRGEILEDLRAHVAGLYEPFAVDVVTERPASGAYLMVMVGNRAGDLGLPFGVAGAAPLVCGGDLDAIAFAFGETIDMSAAYPSQVAYLGDVIAQEAAHAYGLDHVVTCNDVMHPLAGCGTKSFRDVDASCGRVAPTPCYCGGDTQSSFATLAALLGTD